MNIEEMSDEEILAMSAPPVEDDPVPQTEQNIEEPPEQEEEGSNELPEESVSESEPVNEENNSEEGDNSVNNSNTIDSELNNDIKETEADKQTAVSVNYEDFYKKVMAPFKANDKTIQLQSPEEAIKLMQMGANYTKKMQAIAPYKKALMMLENNELLDEDKISFLIDVDKKNPEAIKKLLIDANIDPFEIDTTSAPEYTAGSHKISNEEARFISILDDLKQDQAGAESIQTFNSWDQASKDILWKDPEIMNIIHEQRKSGIYDQICTEMERQMILGGVSPDTPFIERYRQVGDYLFSRPSPVNTPIATQAMGHKSVVTNNGRAKSAAPTKTSASSTKKLVNYLSMSDEEFLKQMMNRL